MPESQTLTGLAVPLTAGGEQPPSRILVVDDEPRNGRLMQMVLRAAGYKTTVVTSGQEALDALEAQSVDLIILDVMMPEMSGFEVCRILRARPATHFLPVILVTALSDV